MILLSYFLFNLYDRHFRVVIWTFLPIKKCLSILHVRVDPTLFLLTTFATFFFLSFYWAIITCLMLLSYIDLLAPNGSVIWRVFLYDATMDYFGPGHLPSPCWPSSYAWYLLLFCSLPTQNVPPWNSSPVLISGHPVSDHIHGTLSVPLQGWHRTKCWQSLLCRFSLSDKTDDLHPVLHDSRLQCIKLLSRAHLANRMGPCYCPICSIQEGCS